MNFIRIIIGLVLAVLLFGQPAGARTRYRDKKEGVAFSVKEIRIHGDTLCYVFEFNNHSPLSYTIGLLRYTIKDRKVIRRHAYQEIRQYPLWVRDYQFRVPAGQRNEWSVAFLQQALGKNQRLDIDIYEQRGARNLRISLNWKNVWKAKFVNEL
jgi:hypothetical protein